MATSSTTVCVCVCVSHPLLPALQRSADVLQVVQLLQQLEAPLPQLALALLLLLAAPCPLPHAAHHPAQVGQRHTPVGGTLLILFHLQGGNKWAGVLGLSFKLNSGSDWFSKFKTWQ